MQVQRNVTPDWVGESPVGIYPVATRRNGGLFEPGLMLRGFIIADDVPWRLPLEEAKRRAVAMLGRSE